VYQQVCRNDLLFEPLLRPLPDILTVVAHDPTQLLSLNCLFFKHGSTQVFTVEIPASENVSILKKMIKEEKACRLAQLDASDLTLYKVSLPAVDVDPKEANTGSKGNSAVTRIHLQPLEELKEVTVFPEPLQKNHVHIIVEHGPGTCPRHR